MFYQFSVKQPGIQCWDKAGVVWRSLDTFCCSLRSSPTSTKPFSISLSYAKVFFLLFLFLLYFPFLFSPLTLSRISLSLCVSLCTDLLIFSNHLLKGTVEMARMGERFKLPANTKGIACYI